MSERVKIEARIEEIKEEIHIFSGCPEFKVSNIPMDILDIMIQLTTLTKPKAFGFWGNRMKVWRLQRELKTLEECLKY